MKYIKKSITIEALEWNGEEDQFQEIRAMGKDSRITINRTPEGKLEIPTLEGVMTADVGDMVIKGIQGELYPCKPDIFQKTYDEVQEPGTTDLNFGEAIAALKAGFKVARKGWNGKNMFLLMNGGYSVLRENVRANNPISEKFLEANGCDKLEILPHIDMWTAQKTLCVGWLASQTDMFAEDWIIIKD